MKNSYVGDIGDFAKYGLLRHLCGMTGDQTGAKPLRLGVVWYLNEGTGTDYLSNKKGEELKECDRELYQQLKGLTLKRYANIDAVRDRGILSFDTLFYDAKLPRTTRRNPQNCWVNGALTKTAGADVVFVDPDKGISPTDSHAGPEHVSIGELKRFWEQDCGPSLVIYQHKNRDETQIKCVTRRIKEGLGLPQSPWVVLWQRIQPRYFVVVPRKKDEETLVNRLKALAESSWGTKRGPKKTPSFKLIHPGGDSPPSR